MNRTIKVLIALVIVIVAIGIFGIPAMKSQTKKASPEENISLTQGDLEVSVFYNRPSKKGREIFGGLVPSGEVWRTGANEATTFTTNKDLTINGKSLPAGKYTLWTIPGYEKWTVIFNSKEYGWGIGFNGKASRDSEADALITEVPVEDLNQVIEQFTIELVKTPTTAMTLAWDQTKITVPFQ